MSKIHPKVQAYLNSVVVRNGQKWIDGYVDLSSLGLTELNFHDIYIKGHFDCYNNRLTTLEGSPKEVGGNFFCTDNQLTTLKGLNEVEGCIQTNKIPNCDYFIQYSLMNKIILV